jgi:hypothetical protein
MTAQEAQDLINQIYREKYFPEGLENSTIAEIREEIRQGRIKSMSAFKLQKIYDKAAGGGQKQEREIIRRPR